MPQERLHRGKIEVLFDAQRKYTRTMITMLGQHVVKEVMHARTLTKSWRQRQMPQMTQPRQQGHVSYFGVGGGLGFGTPVVSYAPLPMLQIAEDFVVSIIVLVPKSAAGSRALYTCKRGFRLSMTQADSLDPKVAVYQANQRALVQWRARDDSDLRMRGWLVICALWWRYQGSRNVGRGGNLCCQRWNGGRTTVQRQLP